MATLPGKLNDLRIKSMASRRPILRFIPSGPGIWRTGEILGSAPIEVSDFTGTFSDSFTVDLAVTDLIQPDCWYDLEIIWLNGENVPIGFDRFPWQIRVHEDTRTVAEAINAPPNPLQAWVDPIPPALHVPSTGWMDENGLYYEWE
jgi:hypothetical protein